MSHRTRPRTKTKTKRTYTRRAFYLFIYSFFFFRSSPFTRIAGRTSARCYGRLCDARFFSLLSFYWRPHFDDVGHVSNRYRIRNERKKKNLRRRLVSRWASQFSTVSWESTSQLSVRAVSSSLFVAVIMNMRTIRPSTRKRSTARTKTPSRQNTRRAQRDYGVSARVYSITSASAGRNSDVKNDRWGDTWYTNRTAPRRCTAQCASHDNWLCSIIRFFSILFFFFFLSIYIIILSLDRFVDDARGRHTRASV